MNPEASSEQQNAEVRASDRVDVCLPGSIAIGGRVVDCELVNLSLTGAKLKIADYLVSGSPAFLRIEELGEFPGEVIWWHNDKVGFAFSCEHEVIAKVVELAHAESESSDCPSSRWSNRHARGIRPKPR